MLFTDSLTGRMVWLAESYRIGALPLSEGSIGRVEDGLKIWAWSGIIVGAISLFLAHQDIRAVVTRSFSWSTDRILRPLPLAADQYGLAFFISTGAILAFTGLTHWSLTAYQDIDWFGGEDGVSEWWSVATYLIAATLAGATAWRLRGTGYTGLTIIQVLLAGLFLIGAMEEISWGQRLFDWGTPQVLDAVKEQGETTIHNLERLEPVLFSLFFWGSAVALAGGAIRASWHLKGKVTNADFFLPSPVLAPALLMIAVWCIGDSWTPVNLLRLIMEAFNYGPQGSEVPEVLLGLCICVYTYANLKRAMALPRPGSATRNENPRKQNRKQKLLNFAGVIAVAQVSFEDRQNGLNCNYPRHAGQQRICAIPCERRFATSPLGNQHERKPHKRQCSEHLYLRRGSNPRWHKESEGQRERDYQIPWGQRHPVTPNKGLYPFAQ